jgi:hypothetical protein
MEKVKNLILESGKNIEKVKRRYGESKVDFEKE